MTCVVKQHCGFLKQKTQMIFKTHFHCFNAFLVATIVKLNSKNLSNGDSKGSPLRSMIFKIKFGAKRRNFVPMAIWTFFATILKHEM